MGYKFKDLLLLALISIGSTVLVWLPFLLNLERFWGINLPHDGMAVVVRNFDGPYYIVVAKTLYASELIKQFEFSLPVEYYVAHFPLYPLFIRLFGTVLIFPYAMLLVTVMFSVLAGWMFYILIGELKFKYAFWLSVLFLMLPARWLVTRSVGSPEPMFIFFVLLSVWGMLKNKYWVAGIAGALAQLTKPPGILLFIAFGLFLLWKIFCKLGSLDKVKFKDFPWSAYPIGLIPLSLICLWLWYGAIYGSFWVYFQSGDNIHLFWPPFQMFNTGATWVGTFWLEDVVWLLLLGALGTALNWKRNDVVGWFTVVYFVSTIFVSHRDFSRYSLPLMPFLLIAFAPVLEKKEFRVTFWVILLPVYLYTINFIAGNTTPISDWGRLL